MANLKSLPVETPDLPDHEIFRDADAAVARLIELYQASAKYLCEHFEKVLMEGQPAVRYRAFYPEIRLTTTSFAPIDNRLSFGHVSEPGRYSTTVTRPDLFANYLKQQINLLMENHRVPVEVGVSMTPMPVHFAVANDASLSIPQDGAMEFTLRDVFDVPDLATTHDDIVNGYGFTHPDGSEPRKHLGAIRF